MRERMLADAEERERPGVFKSIHPVRYLDSLFLAFRP